MPGPSLREMHMSDFSPAEQSFGSIPATQVPLLYEPPVPLSDDIQAHEVAFRQLRGAREIGRILHLRQEIQLPTATVSDTGFAQREKKETKSAWSALSCGKANTSARSACCR